MTSVRRIYLQPVDPIQFTNPVASCQSQSFPDDLQCLPLLTCNNSSIIQHFNNSDLCVITPQAVDPFPSDLENMWGFTSPHILAEGWLLYQRTRRRESLSQRASCAHTEEQQWAGLAVPVRDITVQERGQSSQPPYHGCMSLCMTIKHSFLSCTVIPKRVGLWHI